MPADLGRLTELVGRAAHEELLPRFAVVQRHVKRDGSILTEADLAMQQRLRAELARDWPQYDFLGEEMGGEEHELVAAVAAGRASSLEGRARYGLWCVDPLDGTSNFAAGIPFFAVSLALLVEGEPVLGLVYDPVRAECFTARRAQGVWLNGEPLAAAASAPPLARSIACVDFKRLDRALARRLGESPPYGSQRNFGSSSLEWCWLADGRFHIYVHGGQKLWDYAAGNLILTESGGYSSTLAGEPVHALRIESRSVVAARDPALFRAAHEWLQAGPPV